MDASKENAQQAIEACNHLSAIAGYEATEADHKKVVEAMGFIYKFLEAAKKRLPSQAAINKDRQRRRVKKD